MSRQKSKKALGMVAKADHSKTKKKIAKTKDKYLIKAWEGTIVIAFVFGIAVSSIWMVKTNSLIVSSANSGTTVAADELSQIKAKIQEKHAKWQAGVTEISKLSPEERKKRVMPKELLDSLVPKAPQVTPPATAIAPSYNWSSTGTTGSDSYVTPVKNQGSCGSCWAFAVTATAESATLLKNKTTYSQNPLDLSEQTMVSCSGAGSCSGGYPSTASSFLTSTGLPTESCYPYTATNGSCSSACANWQAATTKINDYASIPSTVSAIKNAIATYGPVEAAFYVYSDFYSYTGGVYSYVTGTLQGAHAVSVVGYDDSLQAFIVKNSWGTGWGEGGFFKIAYSEVGGTTNFGYSVLVFNTSTPVNPPTPDTVAPTVSLTAPADGATLSGTTNVAANASDDVGVSKVEFYLDSKLQYTDTTSPYNYSWNTLLAPNGGHALSAKAYDAAGNVGSSATANVTLQNVPDTQAPTVKITAPQNGSTVSSSVSIKAAASDNIGVASVKCYVDNGLLASATTGTLSTTWNARKAAAGTHIIRVDAADAAGNVGSSSVSVNIAASTPTKR